MRRNRLNPLIGGLLNSALCAGAAGLLCGCDKDNAADHPVPSQSPTATQPASTQQAAIAPTTQPSTLLIDNKRFDFPPAKLRVSKADGHVVARLYTNDPKAALADDYHGNGYDLMMQLDDIDAPAEIYNAVWDFKAVSHDSPSTPYGIFLDGIRYQLTPTIVKAHFIGDTLLVRIDLEGQFTQLNQTDTTAPPKPVYVTGHLLAPVEYKD